MFKVVKSTKVLTVQTGQVRRQFSHGQFQFSFLIWHSFEVHGDIHL